VVTCFCGSIIRSRRRGREGEIFAFFRCRQMRENPPLPRPTINHNMFQSPRIDARRHSPAVLPNTNHRAKERGQNSIRSTCCAQSKIRKSTTAQVAIFLTKVRAMKGRMQKENTTINHIFFLILILGAFLSLTVERLVHCGPHSPPANTWLF